MAKKEDSRDMKCFFCEKMADVNYQKVWTRWRITKDGGYVRDAKFDPLSIEEPTMDENIFMCREHEALWKEGKIG